MSLHSPLGALFLTFATFFVAQRIHRRWPRPYLLPVALTIVALILLLPLLRFPIEAYVALTQPLSLLLGPAVVALAVPLDRQRATLVRPLKVLVVLTIGACLGAFSAAALAQALGATPEVVASLVGKSATTPMAMGIAERLGGNPRLAAAIVIAVGIVGAIVGPGLKKIMKLDPASYGLALGASAHAVGVSQALEEGETEAAHAALALALHGALTAVVAPVVMIVLSWL